MPRKNETTIDIDSTVGIKIHELRVINGLSRQQLASEVGVTHQQLQKYEKGVNRVTIGRMVCIAKALNKPLSYFVDDAVEAPDEHQRMCIEVSRNFLRIKEPANRAAVNHLIKTLAS